MTALRWASMLCRMIALALLAWVILTGWQPIARVLSTHTISIEITIRPRATPPVIEREA